MAINTRTLTAANSVFMLTVPGLFSAPQQLQGYSTDEAFDTEAAEMAETAKGVDGVMSAGFVPFMTNQTVTFQADSPSIDIIEQIVQAQKTAREVLWIQGVIIINSVQRKYALTNGILRTWPPIPGAGKILKPRQAGFVWDTIDPAPN